VIDFFEATPSCANFLTVEEQKNAVVLADTVELAEEKSQSLHSQKPPR